MKECGAFHSFSDFAKGYTEHKIEEDKENRYGYISKILQFVDAVNMRGDVPGLDGRHVIRSSRAWVGMNSTLDPLLLERHGDELVHDQVTVQWLGRMNRYWQWMEVWLLALRTRILTFDPLGELAWRAVWEYDRPFCVHQFLSLWLSLRTKMHLERVYYISEADPRHKLLLSYVHVLLEQLVEKIGGDLVPCEGFVHQFLEEYMGAFTQISQAADLVIDLLLKKWVMVMSLKPFGPRAASASGVVYSHGAFHVMCVPRWFCDSQHFAVWRWGFIE